MRAVVLAHDHFPDRAKTALGVMRYSDYDIAGVLDQENAGATANDFLDDLDEVPIVEDASEIESADVLIIGISVMGGNFDSSWRDDVTTALERGWDVISGLHTFLNEDAEFRALAEENDCDIRDVRKPPDDLGVSDGAAADVDAEVILTVGTDCSIGKMTSTMELCGTAREMGYDAAVIPTGQTGIIVEGWGNPIDRVVSDFVAGAVEEMIVEKGSEHDYLFVEGQGSISHPSYSGVTCGILHGSMPDKLVLCHESNREAVHGFPDTPLPSPGAFGELYESLCDPVQPAKVVAGALNTSQIEDDRKARRAVEEYEAEIGSPATDPVRFSTRETVRTILES